MFFFLSFSFFYSFLFLSASPLRGCPPRTLPASRTPGRRWCRASKSEATGQSHTRALPSPAVVVVIVVGHRGGNAPETIKGLRKERWKKRKRKRRRPRRNLGHGGVPKQDGVEGKQGRANRFFVAFLWETHLGRWELRVCVAGVLGVRIGKTAEKRRI